MSGFSIGRVIKYSLSVMLISGTLIMQELKSPHNITLNGYVESEMARTSSHVYCLEVTSLEYYIGVFRKEHFSINVETEDISGLIHALVDSGENRIFLQTESDVADIGDRFSHPLTGLGRYSQTLIKKMEYIVLDENGVERTTIINRIIKNPVGLEFEKPSKYVSNLIMK